MPYTRITAPSDASSLKVLQTNYDITAKADHPSNEGRASHDAAKTIRGPVQAESSDNFHESKTADVYKLVISARAVQNLEESTTDGPFLLGSLITGGYAVRNSEVWRFCAFLSGRMGRPVVDR